MASYDIATPTFQQVLKMPDRKAQRLAASFDNTRCSLKVISGYHPRLFIADPDFGQPDTDSGTLGERQ